MTSLEALQEQGVTFTAPQAGPVTAPQAGPEKAPLRRERSRAIQRALLSLSENDRSILLLSAQERMHCQEIAQVLGISVTAVKVRLYRARRRLAAALRKEGV